MKNGNGVFRTMRIISIVVAIVALLCGTVWAMAGKFGDHEKRITTVETHITYIKEAVDRIEKKLSE